MSTTVTYGGVPITPTPFVSRSFSPIDYGNRWGYIQTIKLDGFQTGSSGLGRISDIGNMFGTSYQDLVIQSAGDSSYFTASNCILESLTIGNNKLPADFSYNLPYSVTLKSYSVPSGVIDVVDEFTYGENADGTVDVQRKISAKGLQTTQNAIDNAYSFVSNFTGQNPLSVSSPVFAVGATQAVLVSIDESINRLESIYSVSENWKYETGSANNFYTVSTLNTDQSSDAEYVTLKLQTSFNGSITGAISTLRQSVVNFNYYNQLSKYGIATGNCVLSSFNSQEDAGANRINFSADFNSGNIDEINGVWKHDISVDVDEITNINTYSINSSLKVIGSRSRIESVVASKKTEITTGYNHYLGFLYNAVNDSTMYNQFKSSGRPLNPLPNSISIKNPTTTPSLEMSATFDDRDFILVSTVNLPNGKTYPISAGKLGFNVSVDPENWLFNIQKSANIEGHSIVQDLQCKTREKIAISAKGEHMGNSLTNGTDVNSLTTYNQMFALVNGIISEVSGFATPYIMSSDIKSGVFDHSTSQQLTLKTPINPLMSVNKFFGFNANSYNVRQPGSKFGY